MNEQEKSLALAELMEWELDSPLSTKYSYTKYNGLNWRILEPYDASQEGKAQFSDILLKFPEVMFDEYKHWDLDECTQANILDEILRMNGVEI